MKKVLLTLTAGLACTAAFAQTSLNVNDATDINGTLVEETFNNDGSVKAAKHYQPIESFMIDGYLFEFTGTNEKNLPAYYYPTSTSTKTQNEMRFYNATTMTVTAPEGVTMSKIAFTGSNKTPTQSWISTGTWTPSGNNATWTGSANSFSVTITTSWRLTKMEITTTGGGTVDPDLRSTIYEESLTSEAGFNTWTTENVVLPEAASYIWSFGGVNYGAKAAAFIDKVNYASESWFISPVIDATKASDLSLSFEHAANFFQNEENVKNMVTVWARVEGGDWQQLNPSYAGLGTSWSFVNSGDLSLSAFDGKKFQLGYYYTSTDELAGTYELKNIVVTGKGNGGAVVPTPEYTQYEKATSIESGKSYIVTIGTEIGTAIPSTASYGRWALVAGQWEGESLKADASNAITLVEGEEGWTIQDAAGRYIGMDATHLNSFQIYDAVNEGTTWLIEVEDNGEVMIYNVLTDAIVSQSKGAQGTWYTNIAPAVEEEGNEYNYPVLYVQKKADSVEGIAIDNTNAPVEYFNLQGVRVANPENGLYIRRQGTEVRKVLVK